MKLKASILTFFCLLVIAATANSIAAQSPAEISGQAQAAYNAKEYEKSARLYLAAVLAGSRDPNAFYNAACSFALAGKTEEAFTHLNQAIQNGFVNVEHLKKKIPI